MLDSCKLAIDSCIVTDISVTDKLALHPSKIPRDRRCCFVVVASRAGSIYPRTLVVQFPFASNAIARILTFLECPPRSWASTAYIPPQNL